MDTETTFNYGDFGYPDERSFSLALTCGPIVRAEIRKHKAKVKHAKNRLDMAQTVLKTEIEQAGKSNSMTNFIEGWVKMHEDEVERATERLAFLNMVMQERM